MASEVEKLRALLAEARGLVGFLPTHPAGIDAVLEMQKRINAALAEPLVVKPCGDCGKPTTENEFRGEFCPYCEMTRLWNDLYRERDEAQAEVERLRSCDGCPAKAEHHLCDACCHAEPDAINRENRELREEVERLRIENLHIGRALDDALKIQKVACAAAYQRGAEAMREAAAVFVERSIDSMMLRKGLAEDLRDLPVPEDTP